MPEQMHKSGITDAQQMQAHRSLFFAQKAACVPLFARVSSTFPQDILPPQIACFAFQPHLPHIFS